MRTGFFRTPHLFQYPCDHIPGKHTVRKATLIAFRSPLGFHIESQIFNRFKIYLIATFKQTFID